MKKILITLCSFFCYNLTNSSEANLDKNELDNISLEIKNFDKKSGKCSIKIINSDLNRMYFVEIARLKCPSIELSSSKIKFSYSNGALPHVNGQFYYLLSAKSNLHRTNNIRVVDFELQKNVDYTKHIFDADAKIKFTFSLLIIPLVGNGNHLSGNKEITLELSE